MAPALQKFVETYFGRHGLAPQDCAPLVAQIRAHALKRGDFWVRQGARVSEVGFVMTGAVKKVVLTEDGRFVVKGFVFENEHVAPYSSLLRGVPARFSIEAIEPTTLLTCPYATLRECFESSLKWQKFARSVAEEHFLESEDRELDLLTNQAEKSYSQLLATHRHVVSRVSSKDLASYLGIHEVSLGRLKSRRKRKTRPARS